MKKDINLFLHNAEKWSNILKKILRYSHCKFLKLCLTILLQYQGKGFQEYFNGIISIFYVKLCSLGMWEMFNQNKIYPKFIRK